MIQIEIEGKSSNSSSQQHKQQQQQQMSSRGNGGSCQDCGNKAKRDCEHTRCRTCCKTRGLHCPTHVRSTWIPVARRRQLLQQRLSFSSSFPPAPLRLLTSSSSSGLQGRNNNPNFPVEVTAVGNFRCVRVTSDDNGVDQAAYQTSVTIAGHVFKGILYDQGPPPLTSSAGGTGETPSTDHHHQYLHHHQLVGNGGGAGGSTSGGATNPPYAYTHQYPSLYAPTAAFNPTFLPTGMHFFPHHKP